MKQLLYKTVRFCLCVELLIFGYGYFFGDHGLFARFKIEGEQERIIVSISQLKDEIAQLEKKSEEWLKYPFYQEKIAREQLHMARKDDEIFFLT